MTQPHGAAGVRENHQLERRLRERHIRMIAIGGAIGSGLFLGSGGGISQAGPAIIGVYILCGIFIFIIMRALGELLLYRPAIGSFAEYAREFVGPAYGFITGWGYWLTWSVLGMADITAAGLLVKYWFPGVPQYVTALVALAAIVVLNLASVGFFGEGEFWFSSIKIVAIVGLIGAGLATLVFDVGPAASGATLTNLYSHGGLAPQGVGSIFLAFQIVVFSYQGVELIGMTAAEAKNPQRVLPRAINSIPWRIGVFYVGSLIVLLSLFPWTHFSAGESPFVKALTHIGIPAAASIMNFVILASVLSSCSAGLYSNGRLLKKLADDGVAPRKLSRTNRHKVPAAGIIYSAAVMLLGVLVNAVVPDKAYIYITSVATLGAVWSWGMILISHMSYRRQVRAGTAPPSTFRLPWATPLCLITLLFLLGVTVLLGFDSDQRVALYALPIWAAILIGAYLATRKRSQHMADGAESLPAMTVHSPNPTPAPSEDI
ncbi:amino acid permease [Streptomyces sp. RS2]|uniref:amino acid permease n=1 Tax=Streptomyces sp. RS2 TaxID=1451205 RepID=UPI0021F81811|nr:amino acid permease [Streptomyces sp. RS2]MCW1100120.1 amino acid permease [Streptomyces sp. RS2]